MLKIIGAVIFLVGLADFAGSYMDFDLWGGFLGVQLPDLLWQYSAYIEMAVGAFLFSMSPEVEETIES